MIYDGGFLGTNLEHPDFYLMNEAKTYIMKFWRGVQFKQDWLALPVVDGIRDFSIVGETVYLLALPTTGDPVVTVYKWTESTGWLTWASYTSQVSTIQERYMQIEASADGCMVYYITKTGATWNNGGLDVVIDSTGTIRIINNLPSQVYPFRYWIVYNQSAIRIYYKKLSDIDWDDLTPDNYVDGNPAYSLALTLEDTVFYDDEDLMSKSIVGEADNGTRFYCRAIYTNNHYVFYGFNLEEVVGFGVGAVGGVMWVIGNLDEGYYVKNTFRTLGGASSSVPGLDSIYYHYPHASRNGRLLFINGTTLRYCVGARKFCDKSIDFSPFKITTAAQ